ncbi:short chain dehydrogenase/reductase family oxidoreductase [Pusillimonas sp. T7-7]|uniref:SDR family oxidoreductase n=1 Tax=Pusillimonas sp. (strain T7-7) TaxID=1007105 RepID=UPI00020844E0|nr:SDR family oxidoreductase [Pusillimonas sp. T7-7]AEC20919.1 short chain dehydrogenase/reductase family oxidoreductase [Pusillimonas sp. T7-7]
MTAHAPTVLITGASRGIGAATAIAAARDGYNVAINFLKDATAADGVAHAVRQYGRKAVAIQGDVGLPADIPRVFQQAEHHLGPLTALVNNTGITGPIGPFSQTSDATIERVFQVNVFGAMQCARLALECFARHDSNGIIVNVSSVAARTGSPNEYIHYAASKAAVDAFTVGLAREVAATGVRVCGVSPGSTLTEIHATAGEPGRPERVAPKIPMGRLARPEEIAETVAWLLSPAASYMTGTVVQCAGGL